MKKQIEIMIVFCIFLMLIPCLSFINKSQDLNAISSLDTVKILFTKNDKVEKLTMEDYLVGAVLAQMPADFEEEALKSQAVLAHTYIVSRQKAESTSKTANLKGAYISDDTSLYQSYFTKEQAKKFYGDDYDSALKKVTKAVKAVYSKIVTYENEPIIVAFHAVSSGVTESAKDMWGIDIPYLTTVDSRWDKDKSGFEKTTEFKTDELSKLLAKHFKSIDAKLEENSIKITKSTKNGSVISVEINGTTVSGTDFSTALSLPSPCFSISLKSDTFTVKTKGYGHLVGMSQYGANSMAKNKKTYDKILSHYFPNTTITSL